MFSFVNCRQSGASDSVRQEAFLRMVYGRILLAGFAALLAAFVSSAAAAQTRAVLDANTVLLVGPEEAEPVVQAAGDLASDMEKVFGKKPRIVRSPQENAPLTILIGWQSALVRQLRPAAASQAESFTISLARPASGPVVVLTGADMRGAIFAVYQFAQDYLHVDPLYYWTDHAPPRRTRIELPPALDKSFPAPLFKYRGWFINDEDLLTGWSPGAKGEGTGISLEVWDKIYETILRLKGNMVCPGTWIFPDEPQIRLAGKRGLIVSQHHAIPLGMNVARWPEGVPYSYTSHPEILERAWTNAVNAYPPGVEVLWSLGLRGLSDASYAAYDLSVGNDNAALGRLIGKAMDTQMRIVRAARPDAQFVTNLWQEGARLVQEGHLQIPAGVGTVWADDGFGYLQDRGQVTAGQGAYYHVAMMNFRANQLTEMVPVDRIASELGRFAKAGATHYVLLNNSDVRPVSMTTKAVMDLAWKGPSTEVTNAMTFYRDWSAEQFGQKAADTVAALYKDYFEAPARTAREPVREYGDQYYHTESRILLRAYAIDGPLYTIPGQAPLWMPYRLTEPPSRLPRQPGRQSLAEIAAGEAQRCRDAQPRWDALWARAVKAEQLVALQRRPFYRAHVLAMIAISRESNRILASAGEAVQAAQAGDRAKARAAAGRALLAVAEIRRVESAAEYGKWKNWYRGDWLTNIGRTGELFANFARLMDDPLSPLPAPILWENWEAYHHIMQYEGDRTADIR
jgi:hypothetical protein